MNTPSNTWRGVAVAWLVLMAVIMVVVAAAYLPAGWGFPT